MRGLVAGAALALVMVACQPAQGNRAQAVAIAADWLNAHNAGQPEWAATFYAPDALIRDSDGLTFRGSAAASAWERLTSGLYRYEVMDAAWVDSDTLRWELAASPVQFVGPPRHLQLTVRAGHIIQFDWFAAPRLPAPAATVSRAAGGGLWPPTLVGSATAAAAALWVLASRRRTRSATPRLSLIEPLREFAETRRLA